MTWMMETVEIGLETVRRYRSWQMSTGRVFHSRIALGKKV